MVEIVELNNDKRQITVHPKGKPINRIDQEIQTTYPVWLIEEFLDVKGPRALIDEIRREEDPEYVTICLEQELLAYLPESEFENKHIMDFGCGAGASTIVLAKLFPKATITGVELDPKLIELANLRKEHHGLNNISFQCSPNGQTLPPDIGGFDFILLSAVFEHLLPDERDLILSQLWACLEPDGILFLNQTPYRYFPFEGHTSRLLFVNYLPDKFAHYYVKKYSKRMRGNETWQELLRSGIRGGSPHEVFGILKNINKDHRPVTLKPSRLGYRDRIDIWYAGYAVTIAKKYPKFKRIQQVLRIFAKIIYRMTGVVFLPTLSLAIKKTAL
jgi:2-polyprenyl-3-methyl-5-hydroxy-6-metoxy-1,4-benzoquinol methylase